MTNSLAAFPLFKIRKKTTDDFLAKAEVLAKEENVSLSQYLAGMLKHALRGHDLSKIHFYQDGSGDTYNTDVLDEIARQSDVESAAGLTTVCKTKEELFAHLEKLKAEVDAGEEID
ncbi:MAG: hypothetical protein LBK24_02400 [Puniceicoccales bacterium]|jgi:hypothetical protein|nr:hypothetical protein [Puniceicoccales bacterium]